MKVLYDHQIFDLQSFGGISRYFVELIRHLPKQIDTEVSALHSENVYLQAFMQESGLTTTATSKEKWNFSCLLNKKQGARQNTDLYKVNRQKTIEALKKQDFDLFHPTYYDHYFLKHLGNKPFVLTVHDMIYELFPEMLGDFQLGIDKANLISKASHIIAVSERTKQDIISITGTQEEKISVIYHAVSLNQKTPDKEKITHLPDNYLLFVGTRDLYKNFLFLAQAILPILRKNKGLFLLCSGKPFSQKELDFLRMHHIEDRFLHIFADEDLLFYLYQHAIALLFPSYYEGFGIPVLEAFGASCPVILANASCFPEIAKNAALYFDPKNAAELRDNIGLLMHDNRLREDLIKKGKQRLSDFSWRKSAEETYAIYEKVLRQ